MKRKIIFLAGFFLLMPLIVKGDVFGQKTNFFVDLNYDAQSREKISATLIKVTNKLYFYADDYWWNKLEISKRDQIDRKLYDLSTEFEYQIYPRLTNIFGFEPKPGIDGDEKITVLIQPMKKEIGGYIRTADLYPRILSPKSNEREMFYFNPKYLEDPFVKGFLAHEFMHLITFNQKEKLQNLEEEIWLTEAYSESAISILGYEEPFEGSNLERRLKDFLKNPSDSLTEWKNEAPDYAIVNLFSQYLIDHYGKEILVEALKSNKVGIESINLALKKLGYNFDFSQIFRDWTIAVLLNDCQLGKNYCYFQKNLKNLKITPTVYYLPSKAESVLSTFHLVSGWAGNWQKIIGGDSNLSLKFDGQDGVPFQVPYLLCAEKCELRFLELNEKNESQIFISDFQKYYSLILIPQVHSTAGGSFSWQVSTKKEAKEDLELKAKLIAQIEKLKREIATLQAQTILLPKPESNFLTCQKIENNLYYGMMANNEVKCLQEFLKTQGSEIYPQGLVTGNFLQLTKRAVIRFQEKYANEILKPLGLENGTGYVGPLTRAKINSFFTQ